MRRRYVLIAAATTLALGFGAMPGSAATAVVKPPKLCRIASSATDKTGDSELLGIDADEAAKTLDALREARKLAADRSTKKAINALIRVYEDLADGPGAKARKSLERYLDKHCSSGLDIDPCELVTKADAETLAGTPLEDGVAGNPKEPSCTYLGPTTGPTAQVEVFVGAGAKKTLDIDRDLGHTFTPIAGLEEAFAEENSVFVHQSGVWVEIRLVRLNDPAQNAPALEALARQVADKL
jgi:hypothetical protein